MLAERHKTLLPMTYFRIEIILVLCGFASPSRNVHTRAVSRKLIESNGLVDDMLLRINEDMIDTSHAGNEALRRSFQRTH